MPTERERMNQQGIANDQANLEQYQRDQRTADMDELRRRQAAMGNQTPFSANYGYADKARDQALASSREMSQATDLMRQTALTGDAQARESLRQGVRTAQGGNTAAASVARGGPLSKAAANLASLNANSTMAAEGVGAEAESDARTRNEALGQLTQMTGAQRNFGHGLQAMDANRAVADQRFRFGQQEQGREFMRGYGDLETGAYAAEQKRAQAQKQLEFEKQAHQDQVSNERKGIGQQAVKAGAGFVKSLFSDERSKIAAAAVNHRRMR